MTRYTRLLGLKGAGVVLATLVVGCHEDDPEDEACNPPLAEVEIVEGVTALRCVDYDGDPMAGSDLPDFGELPEGVGTEEFTHCFDLEPGRACDGCGFDDTEELMRSAYVEAKECELPITDNVGGCSHWYTTEDGYGAQCCTAADCEEIVHEYARGCAYTDAETGQCCYTAAIASPCAGRSVN
jgi:hypothetical protein